MYLFFYNDLISIPATVIFIKLEYVINKKISSDLTDIHFIKN